MPVGTTKYNSAAPLLLEDIHILANRLENEFNERVGITRFDVHLGYVVNQVAILAVLDRMKIPCIEGVSYFGTSDTSVESQVARKSLAYLRGSIISIGKLPRDPTTLLAVIEALGQQTRSLEYRVEKNSRAYQTAQEKVSELTNENTELKNRLSERDAEETTGKRKASEAELEEAHEKLRKTKESKRAYKDEAAKLRSKVDDLREEHKREMGTLNKQLGDLRDTQKHELDDLRERVEDRIKAATHDARADLLQERRHVERANRETALERKKRGETIRRLRKASRLLGRVCRALSGPDGQLRATVAAVSARLEGITEERVQREWDELEGPEE